MSSTLRRGGTLMSSSKFLGITRQPRPMTQTRGKGDTVRGLEFTPHCNASMFTLTVFRGGLTCLGELSAITGRRPWGSR
jgi:hypothetical protein